MLTLFLSISVYIIKTSTLNKCSGGQSKLWNNYSARNADLNKQSARLRLVVRYSQNTLMWIYPPRIEEDWEQKRQKIHKSLQKGSFIHQARI